MNLSAIEWGTAADWAAAVGTMLAFGAAMWVIYRERVDRRMDAARRRDEDARRRRAQAESIAVWLEGNRVPDSSDDGEESIIKTRNVSGAPVSNCVAFVRHPVGGPVDEPEHPDNIPLEFIIGTLAPGETVTDKIPRRWINPDLIVFPGLLAEVAFTDSAGVHWL